MHHIIYALGNGYLILPSFEQKINVNMLINVNNQYQDNYVNTEDQGIGLNESGENELI